MNIILNKLFEPINLKSVVRIFLIILMSIGLISGFTINAAMSKEKSDEVHGEIENNDDVKNFMDNYFNKNMEKYSVPGALVVVVKDNKEVFKMGYGYSNLESKSLVNPDETMFPAGSVSKLFTSTAILQLYEEGKIDLDTNVNDYINPYKISNMYNEPVTCRNLLTHSSGLDEESELNLSTTDANSIKSQEYYFDNHPLKVITEPNTICRYSNIGYNLLGYIVEKVSGITYEEYVEEKILKPLNMSNSLVRLKNSDIAKGYIYNDEKYSELPFSYQYTSGSSGIITTVKDMENFIMANLNDGKFQNNNILKPKTLSLMHEKQFSNSDALEGMGFGFIRSYRNGQEIIKHEGGLPSGYTTTLFLIPKENLGIYVATNSLSGLPFDFEEDFLNYFYPHSNDFNIEKINGSKDYSKYEGTYRSYDGISKTNIMKMAVLFDDDMEIKDNKDGTLTLHETTQSKEKITTKLIELENGVFLREDGKGKFTFKFDNDGKVTYAFNDISINSFEKLKFYEQSKFIILSVGTIVIIFIINIILCVLSFIKRKNRDDKKLERTKIIEILKYANISIEVFYIIGVLGVIISTLEMCLNSEYNLSYLLYSLLTLLIIATIIVIVSLALSIYSLIKKKGIIRQRLYYMFLNMMNLGLIWFLCYFNFLGYKLF